MFCRFHGERIVKDVVAFSAVNFLDVVNKLQLDLHEPPVSQVSGMQFCKNLYIILFSSY